MLRFLFISFFLFVFAYSAKAQHPSFRHITREAGLPSMTINSIIQDHKGFIWLGTEEGLSRYDGNEFINFGEELLGNENVETVFWFDKQVWAITESGLLFYQQKDSIRLFNPRGILNARSVQNISNDSKNNLWISTNKSIFKFRKNEQSEWVLDVEIKRKNYRPIVEDSKGTIWAVTSKGISHIIGSQCLLLISSASFYGHDIKPYPLRYGQVLFMYPEGMLKTVSEDTLRSFFDYDPGFKKELNDVFEDTQENLWVLAKDGAYLFDQSKQALNPNKPYFKDKDLSCIIQDIEGNYWIGTKGYGLYLLPGIDFVTYTRENSDISNNSIHALAKDLNGNLILGLDDGKVNIIENNQITKLSTGKDGKILNILPRKNNELWLAGDGGVHVFDSALPNVKPIYFPESKWFKVLKEDPQGDIWGGSYYSMQVFRDYRLYKEVIPSGVYDILFDDYPRGWLGMKNGLFYFDGSDISPFDTSGLILQEEVSKLAYDKDSVIWVATRGEGVYGIKDGKVLHHLDQKSGLADDFCNTLFVDNKANILVGTRKGLNIVRPPEYKKINLVNRLDGLVADEVTAIHKINDTIWVGTSRGLTYFKETAIEENTLAPPIYITNFKVSQRDTSILESYDLKHKQNNIEIEFIGMSYKSSNEFQYKYKIEGIDSNWTYTNENAVKYLSLSPNNYNFIVKSVNADGVESMEAASISFTINKPYWARPWFIISAILASLALIAFIVKTRINKIRKEEAVNQKIAKEQLKAVRAQLKALHAQMNPHFIFNCMYALQQLITSNDREKAIKFISKFGKLIRGVFEHSKKDTISLEDELEFLDLYLELEKMRFSQKVETFISLDPNLDKENSMIPPMLIQPIIENAFRHGLMHKETNGKLEIEFKWLKGDLECVIRDNGVGRAKAKELSGWKPKKYQSSGLHLTEERLTILNAANENSVNFKVNDLMDEAGEAAGTEVILLIKLKKN